eukprot:TRINITY_DN1251_c0_g1_i1.p1 TRINITY_DN1251_c0_g1~~TRINITY_DN1251_c0_g1_i1.p1  ORF type:complete len:359 (-),score=100.10 TRINITY_DN1251_c0_g1_i1:39-1115(-)
MVCHRGFALALAALVATSTFDAAAAAALSREEAPRGPAEAAGARRSSASRSVDATASPAALRTQSDDDAVQAAQSSLMRRAAAEGQPLHTAPDDGVAAAALQLHAERRNATPAAPDPAPDPAPAPAPPPPATPAPTTTTVTVTQTTTKTVTKTTSKNYTDGFLIIRTTKPLKFTKDERVKEAVIDIVAKTDEVFKKDVNVSIECVKNCGEKDEEKAEAENKDDDASLLEQSTGATDSMETPGLSFGFALLDRGRTMASLIRQAARQQTSEGVVAVEYQIKGTDTDDQVQDKEDADLTMSLVQGLEGQNGETYEMSVVGKTGSKSEVAGIVKMVAGGAASGGPQWSLLFAALAGLLWHA